MDIVKDKKAPEAEKDTKKPLNEAASWKYLQYPTTKEAKEAREAHFLNGGAEEACRHMGNGKLAHKGQFHGPKPNMPMVSMKEAVAPNELEEVSKGKLHAYMNATQKDSNHILNDIESGKNTSYLNDPVIKRERTNRYNGVMRAIDKTSKNGHAKVNATEESIQEVSTSTAAEYARAAIKDEHPHKGEQRKRGVELATKKIAGDAKVPTSEEAEEPLNEISRDLAHNYIMKSFDKRRALRKDKDYDGLKKSYNGTRLARRKLIGNDGPIGDAEAKMRGGKIKVPATRKPLSEASNEAPNIQRLSEEEKAVKSRARRIKKILGKSLAEDTEANTNKPYVDPNELAGNTGAKTLTGLPKNKIEFDPTFKDIPGTTPQIRSGTPN